jgi:GDPmannose 4,6-dehydratase
VIATGITTTIRDFIKLAATEIGLELAFVGEGANEKGYLVGVDEIVFKDKVGENYLEAIKSRIAPSHSLLHSPSQIVGIDPAYFRPTEVDLLIGDPTKAMTKLGWKPQYDLKGLVEDMMQSDIKLMKKDAYLREGGYRTLNYFE